MQFSRRFNAAKWPRFYFLQNKKLKSKKNPKSQPSDLDFIHVAINALADRVYNLELKNRALNTRIVELSAYCDSINQKLLDIDRVRDESRG